LVPGIQKNKITIPRPRSGLCTQETGASGPFFPRLGNRRQFFRTGLSAALVGLTAKADRPIAGSFVNESAPMGHRLRDRAAFPAPAQRLRVPLVIVGGGMAGLCAAWRLEKKGFRDFVLLEMESEAGGNSRWGENEVSRYPWAAHYVPVPNAEAVLVRELLTEFGILNNGEFDERHLCFSPQERLFLHGRWQEGLEPEIAATRSDRQQYARFESLMAEFAATRQFTIPLDESGVRDPRLLALDRISMAEWMRQQKLDSPYLRWYVDYSCRDDYGSSLADTSAFAGALYFAGRQHDEKGPITWPEGNGWIVQRLLSKLARFVRTGSPVYAIRAQGTRYRVLTAKAQYETEAVIFAAPTFLAHYLIEGMPKADGFSYSPWLTANLTLDHWPRERGLDPAWDNVIYDSPSLGYVVATHMSLRSRVDRTVWTYYYAMAEGGPARQRERLLGTDWNAWKEFILDDLSRPHPTCASASRASTSCAWGMPWPGLRPDS
jgi:phytoene dehydrogenase-like protein